MDQVYYHRWQSFFKNPQLHADRRNWLTPNSKIFTMGSCFAVSVRDSLAAKGLKVYPDYESVAYDPVGQIFDKIPFARKMIAHYDTFVMLQEIEAALDLWPGRGDGYCLVTNQLRDEKVPVAAYQDPYRKLVYGSDLPLLHDLSDKITAKIRDGLEQADILIFTLGLTEVWQQNSTGKYLCQAPGTGYGGMSMAEATFKQSTFLENYTNLRRMLDIIFERYPNKKVVISVSPVRLAETYAQIDVATANLESKSILRAVAGQVCREYGDKVLYFPSYEMAQAGIGAFTATGTVFEPDGRHVQKSFVDSVMTAFEQVTGANPA